MESADVRDISNSPAYQSLDELVASGKLTQPQAQLYRSKYAKLHEVVLKTYENEKNLLKKAKLSETTLRLTVLGLTADAARFCDGSEKAKPAAPPAPSSPKPKPKLNAPLAKSPSRMAVSCATLPALGR